MPSTYLTFTFVAAALAVSPGADTMLVVRSVARGGRSRGIASALGICSGLLVYATLSALGVSVVLMHSPAAFQALKFAGAAYLVWLGVGSLRRCLRGPAADAVPSDGTARGSLRRRWAEGLLTNLLNPKVAVFYVAFLPQFIAPGDPVVVKSLLLAGIHLGLSLAWLSGLAVLLHGARGLILRPRVRRALEGFSGTVLVGLGLRLVLVER